MRALDRTARRGTTGVRAGSGSLPCLVREASTHAREDCLLVVESHQFLSLGCYSGQKNHSVSPVRRRRRSGQSRTSHTRETIESREGAVCLCLVLVLRGRSRVF